MDINDGVTGEVYLDIEVIGAMAPKATIDVYFAPWSGEGYLNAVEQAIHNDDYAAVSISYGFDEDMKETARQPRLAVDSINMSTRLSAMPSPSAFRSSFPPAIRAPAACAASSTTAMK